MSPVLTSISFTLSLLVHGLLLWTFNTPSEYSPQLKTAVSSISVVMISSKPSQNGNENRPQPMQQAHSSGVVDESKPQLLKPLAPEYPWRSRILGEEGEVKAIFNLSHDGKPYNIRITRSSGFQRLDQSALAAIALAEYKNGSPSSKEVEIALDFKLRQKQ